MSFFFYENGIKLYHSSLSFFCVPIVVCLYFSFVFCDRCSFENFSVQYLQYAGTDALKGDITRSGQWNLVGMVKDGYNSASRYYLSHMRDAQRQLVVDSLLGNFTLLMFVT